MDRCVSVCAAPYTEIGFDCPGRHYGGAVTYLASSSRGVFAHFVVRVVVMALESAVTDATESSNGSTKQRSLILKVAPETRVHEAVE